MTELKKILDDKWSFWDEIKFHWYNDFWYPLKNVFRGVRNFWYFRKEIWRFRWWDYSFFMDLQKKALEDMNNHWRKDTHYLFDWNEKLLLTRLVEILDEIEYIQEEMPDSMTYKEQEDKIQELYQEYGELLYKIREFEKEGYEHKYEYKTNGIQTLWD